jgi:hypothetical protein
MIVSIFASTSGARLSLTGAVISRTLKPGPDRLLKLSRQRPRVP